jgi:hypothetical protein
VNDQDALLFSPQARRKRSLDFKLRSFCRNDLLAMMIVSGGQTGVDRAALDRAIARGLSHGGWCPRGRRSEGGVIPPQYQLREMPSESYQKRTEQNVIDSDGTVIFALDPILSGGTLQTSVFAKLHGKPLLQLHLGEPNVAVRLAEFVRRHHIETLNVAGPRASEQPSAAVFATETLDRAFPPAHH